MSRPPGVSSTDCLAARGAARVVYRPARGHPVRGLGVGLRLTAQDVLGIPGAAEQKTRLRTARRRAHCRS